MAVARAARFRWENAPISGRMVRSPGRNAPICAGDCADLRENARRDLRENGAFSGRAGLPGRALLRPLCVALAASMVGGGASIACALGRILPAAAAWLHGKDRRVLGRILPRRGEWENDWEMDVSSVGMYSVPNVVLDDNKNNTE